MFSEKEKLYHGTGLKDISRLSLIWKYKIIYFAMYSWMKIKHSFCLMPKEGVMKLSATIISICLTLFLFCGGCSREEPPPPPTKKIKVVKPIKRPPPEKDETEEKEDKEIKASSVEEKALKAPEIDAGEKETAMEEVTGYYIVKKGDSLSSITGREDVYGDSLKWPIIYRLNMDKLDKLQLGDDLPGRELPEGVRLQIILPDEVKENLKRRANNVWAINVLSTTTNGKIIPVAIRLIKNGYLVYITRTKVKGKDWIRLRVGFFKNKTEADTEVKKIMTMLNLADSWIAKVGKKELGEFGGY